MINQESKTSKAQQKARIRERYKGIDPDVLEVIPARKRADFYDDEPRRVAVYVRVSTDDPRQTSSYELQKNYYEDIVQRHETWTLVDIYADEGISGTSLQHRDAFNRMITDCKAGKIDMIITKSVSRFARNIVDCISIVRELGALNPPIGIFFETEHIFTLKDDTEMGLSFQATMAQEESHIKSNIMNASIEMRFSHGIVLTPVLLGYDHDEDGNLVINEEEAETVRLIFFMYLYGYTCQQIAETLTELERKTKKGNTTWSSSSVLQQLRNERHCGEVLTRKTFTPSYLNHKAKKNVGDRTQHRWRDHHEAIIPRDDFIAVQHLLDNAKYGNKGLLPQLQVIPSGALKGFVSINPRWAGFSADDYRTASESVYGDNESFLPYDTESYEANTGDFDFRGFEIARSQFFDNKDRICVTFGQESLVFSMTSLRKLELTPFVELLIHPELHLLAVRKCEKTYRNAIRWTRSNKKGTSPRPIPGGAYIKTLYELLDWSTDCKYRIRGIRKQHDGDRALLFDLSETEVFVPNEKVLQQALQKELPTPEEIQPLIPNTGNRTTAYPSQWADTFGSDFYLQSQSESSDKSEWRITEETLPYSNLDLSVTPANEIVTGIQSIIRRIKEEPAHELVGSASDY